MTTRTLAKAEWRTYFDRVAAGLQGKRASVEITSEALGDQWAARRLPLLGITYDDKDDLVEVAMDGVDHLVLHPDAIKIDEQAGGLACLEITARDGTRQIVTLVDPVMLPAS
ncbi:MAG TPA: DUF5335 family protein [Sphingomonadaceae bacterium]|nr:DUF5335 family protein [Sphingomonadaceae bacterium]